jgi:MYXO-CTERM domain-containing protein
VALLLTAGGALATPEDGLLDPCVKGAVAGADAETFKDMPPGSLGHDEAELLYNEGITSGCQTSPLLFCADCEITRVAMVTLVVRAAKLPLEDPATPTFSDVPSTSPFYGEVEAAAKAGITQGCGAGAFCPDAPVPRGAGATLVAKGAQIASLSPSTPSFSDVDSSNPFYGSIEALLAACVTQGCSATEFCPNREMTRAEAAVFIARAFDLSDINVCIGATDAGADATPDAGTGGTWTDSGIGPVTGGAGGAAGSSGGGGRGDTTADDGGCGCSTPRGTPAQGTLLLLAGLALLGLRRQSASG